MQIFSKFLTISVFLIASSFSAVGHAEWQVKDATIRVLPPGVKNTAVYFSIENTASTDRQLVDVSTNVASNSELHAHIMDGEMMRMEKQSSITVPAGETVKFKPGGYHVMVFGLDKPLSVGQQVEVTLHTQDGQTIVFLAEGVLPGDEKVSSHHHHH